ncbi:MAG: M20/M25/M40 family metallo-hydrolase, partial [Cyanobacteriota bacterium]
MALIARLQELAPIMAAWRRDLHAHPETAFAEHRTAALVAERLASFGCEVHTGLAGTGVVGVLRAGAGKAGASQAGTGMPGSPARSIGLRADMDALPITEANTFAHGSRHPGRMHACGHDGHTTMLLGAAQY